MISGQRSDRREWEDPQNAFFLDHISREIPHPGEFGTAAHSAGEEQATSNSVPTPRRLRILHDITACIPASQITCVVGPSGAGKSSLLRLLNRLDSPTSGTIYWRGRSLESYPVRQLRRQVGMLFQFPHLFEGTVEQNVLFGPRLQPSSTSQADGAARQPQATGPALVAELLRMVGLPAELAGRSTEKLSGGEAARVALARALANQPQVLLLDEPTASLDVASRREIEQLILRLQRESGLTVVWVSHDLEQAARVADRVMVIEHGELTAFGRPDVILPAFETQLEADRR
ncbi:MAG: ATP-binding cassette domain-containing protein [Limnochordaceae bacterium]|nr:ATP-binding cassette domain-containing protein [Limnochordaceae bacterium]